jgi:choline dehydrogenase
VTLTSMDPEAPPRLEHGFLSDAGGHDLAGLVEGAELAREFASRPPLAELLGAEVEPGPGVDLAAAIRAGVIHCWHPVGTCAIGIACDERGRVHGVDGLVVADASLFPQTVRATTNLPTVVAGERVARWLVE